MFKSATALFAAALLLIAATGALFAADRPNIILMMADDLGWGDVGFNGNTIIQTPHLDAMAGAGLRFERFYAAAPVCSPTRGSCLTGRHPFRYGIFFANTGHMKPPELTLAELLRELGYATGHFGKWHLGTLTKTIKDANRGGPRGAKHYASPWDNGFDICFSTESKVPTFDPMLRPPGVRRGTWWNPVTPDQRGAASAYGTYYWTNGKRVEDNLAGPNSRVIMDRALPFIQGAVEAKKPFFAVIWFHTPHLPVVAGPKHSAPYAKYSDYEKHYFGCITAMDEQIGRLRGALRELGVANQTMLWFCSDNGPEGAKGKAPGSAGHLRGRKRDLFEGGVRVPGVLEWPARVKAGGVTKIPACTSDYLPTILSVVGAKLPDDRPIDGVSLLPLIDGKMTARPTPIAFESAGQLALIDNQYKIIQPKKRRGEQAAFMLFDLLADPSEQQDLVQQHPQILADMKAKLAKWREACKQSLNGADYPAKPK